jgi:phosphatidylethanolamine/phosphatidyl-N-methylethanolamine N-methyltransferase
LSRESVRSAYRRYAKVYDLLFGAVLAPGRRLALKLLQASPSQKILEIGVGTGLALPLYDPAVDVTGVDLSFEMLQKARQRIMASPRKIQLLEMDAQALQFKDGSFDASVAMYVMSVAPDPRAVLEEMQRVTKPGGRLVIVNHFSIRGQLSERLERLISPLSGPIGFEPLFHLDDFVALTGIKDFEVHEVPPLGFWKVLSWRSPPRS